MITASLIFAPLINPFRHSLALRWVGLVSLIAGLGVTLMLAVTHFEIQNRLRKEQAALLALAEQKTADRLDADIALVTHRLKDIVSNLGDDLEALANAPSTLQAIRSRNDVRIADQIGKRLRRIGFTTGLVLDQKLAVIGADQTGLELVSFHAALKMSELNEIFRELIENNDRKRPNIYKFVGVIDHALAAILPGAQAESYGIVIAWPVFDDFGDAAGLVLGFHKLQPGEPGLIDFSQTTQTSIALMRDQDILSVAGGLSLDITLSEPDHAGLQHVLTLPLVARCGTSLPGLSACVMRPSAEITRFRDEITAIGITESRHTQNKLLMIGGFGILMIIALMSALTRHLSKPLSDISEAVKRVAEGEWQVEVKHAERVDEVGMIARAVASMHLSLIERDRMRQEMVRIDAINQRRLVLDGALSRFEEDMVSVMHNISLTVQNLSRSNDVIDRSAQDANQQAERIILSSKDTALKASRVSDATLHLTQSIEEISQTLHKTHHVVHLGEGHLVEAEGGIVEITGLAREAENALASMQTLIADLGHLGLSASIEAVRSGENGQGFLPIAKGVSTLAAKSALAMDEISRELVALNGVASGTASTLGDVKTVLGDAIRHTSDMAVSIEEQKAAARSIADGLIAAAQAMSEVTEAVNTLSSNISGAHLATTGFVRAARRIVNDAKSIDESLRTFLREAVAE